MTASTVGAGKSQAGDDERFGPDSPAFWPSLGLIMMVLVPVGFVVYVIASALGQHRKVRTSRMVMWAVAASAAGFAVAGFNPVRMGTGHLLSYVAVLQAAGMDSWIGVVARFLALDAPTLPQVSLGSAVIHQIPLGLILGSWLAAARVAWGRFRRLALNDLEGKNYSAVRPFGILDEVRRRGSAAAIRSGRAVKRPRGGKRDTIAVGTGRYGHVINVPVRELQRPTMVLGMIRSGKTALACSLIGQAAQGGVIVIDFKGDTGAGSTAEFWARFAVANNRRFKHFILADKNGAPYRPPVDGVPTEPACWDPLRHGNADSKTSMLLGSVDRTGDAAAYLRSASEFVMLAYQVATLTGQIDPSDRSRSGFQTLHDLCDPAILSNALTLRGGDGKPYLDPTNPQHASIRGRVEDIEAKFRTDSLLRDAVQSTKSLLSSYMNGAAAGPWLRSGSTPDSDIELLDAVLNGHVVVFSLPVQDYKELASVIGNLVLLNLNNTIASLRQLTQQGRSWPDCYLQIEEFGSARPEAILDVLNKSGDSGIRPWLSTQSYSDIATDGHETQARRILDQAGNIFTFTVNDNSGPMVLSELTQQVGRNYPRTDKEYKAGLFGIGTAAANTGKLTTDLKLERQLLPSHIQGLARQTTHDNRRSNRRRRYECIWIAAYDGKRVTHTFKEGPNQWVEPIRVELCPPEATATRFKRQVHTITTAAANSELGTSPTSLGSRGVVEPNVTSSPKSPPSDPESPTPDSPVAPDVPPAGDDGGEQAPSTPISTPGTGHDVDPRTHPDGYAPGPPSDWPDDEQTPRSAPWVSATKQRTANARFGDDELLDDDPFAAPK